jgi:hypothetical protein
MGYSTKILLDSISLNGRRLTTWELTYPRMVHAELLTHRFFSRNSASSRAIPNEKLRQRVKDDPALPVWWGKNQAGMQAREELTGDVLHKVKIDWLNARDQMLAASENLAKMGLHKQLCNRLIEPWMFITVIVSATSFDNWFHLRNHKDAQPEIAWVARDMHEKYRLSTPTVLNVGEWHLPLIEPKDRLECGTTNLRKVSVGRCARVSYLTHDGKRDLAEDIALHDKLLAGAATGEPMHMSPFEHVAQCLVNPNEQSGNFRGWRQYRKMIAGEHFGEQLP